ncbi:MAG: hypothetical protein HUU57_14165 [Bdellovibrio sp.]|nr:hypothetical protein [Bdellovibrio sp.]
MSQAAGGFGFVQKFYRYYLYVKNVTEEIRRIIVYVLFGNDKRAKKAENFMKKLFVGLLVSFIAVQAYADKEYVCIDSKTGKDAGKLRGENGYIIYSNLRTSAEGWMLTINEDGELYNADLMVKHGQAFFVGNLTYENFKLLVNISGRKMICD